MSSCVYCRATSSRNSRKSPLLANKLSGTQPPSENHNLSFLFSSLWMGKTEKIRVEPMDDHCSIMMSKGPPSREHKKSSMSPQSCPKSGAVRVCERKMTRGLLLLNTLTLRLHVWELTSSAGDRRQFFLPWLGGTVRGCCQNNSGEQCWLQWSASEQLLPWGSTASNTQTHNVSPLIYDWIKGAKDFHFYDLLIELWV